MSSLLHRGLHATTDAPPGMRGCWGYIEIPLVTKDALVTGVTSLVEWLGMRKMKLHLSVYSGMLTQRALPPLEMPGEYRAAGIATVSELPTSTEEMLLRVTQCWLIPEQVDGDRVVFEILGFTAAGEKEKKANVLIRTRPDAALLEVRDVLRARRSTLSGLHKGTVTGLAKEVANFDGKGMALVQLSAETWELSRKVECIAPKRISIEKPAFGWCQSTHITPAGALNVRT